MTIRAAVVGYGTGGRVFHAPLIEAESRLELTAIVTGDEQRKAMAEERHPGVSVVPDVDVLFEDGNFDLLVVSSPNTTHVPLARRAIDAGVPVVLDKPIATSAADARRVVEQAEDAGVPLTVFQNRRWDDDFLTLQHTLQSDELGCIRQFDSAFEWLAPAQPTPWKDRSTHAEGGGILFDIGPHLIDQALLLFGDVIDVHAELDRRRDGAPADDESFVTLHHRNGVRTRLWMSIVSPAMRPRFRVTGADAVLQTEGLDPQERHSKEGMRPGEAGFGVREDHASAKIAGAGGTHAVHFIPGRHIAFYEQLADALNGKGGLPVDPHDSIRALEIIEQAVAQSAAPRLEP